MKSYTVAFKGWGRTVEVWARFDRDALESARIVAELPEKALWAGRIVACEPVANS